MTGYEFSQAEGYNEDGEELTEEELEALEAEMAEMARKEGWA